MSENKKKFTLKQRDRQILGIALPSILSNITVPLLGMVDVAIVGHIGNAAYIGAIAVGSMMFNLIYWILGFLRMGTSGMTSQALGRRDLTEVIRLLVRSATVALCLALFLLVFQRPILSLLLLLIHPTTDVLPLASTYYNICIWGAPAMLCLYTLSGWFIGMQNTRFPLFVAIVQNLVNIVASLLMVFVLHWGLRGVALGTVIAQYSGLFLALFVTVRYYGRLHSFFVGKGLLRYSEIKRFLAVNRDIFLRTLFLVSVNLCFTSIGARQGAVVLSVNTLLMQFLLLFSYVMDGFAYAGEALAGRYHGAANHGAFMETVKRLMHWGLLMASLFTIVYVFGANHLVNLLTDDTVVRCAAEPYLPWAWIIPLLGVCAFVWDGIFIGITATRSMLLSTFVSALCFFVVSWGLLPLWGNHALWLAMDLFLFVRGLVLLIVYFCRVRQRIG